MDAVATIAKGCVMKAKEVYDGYRQEYKETCPLCKREQLILTQRNNFPEYHTEIYLQCQCGEFIEFILPVN